MFFKSSCNNSYLYFIFKWFIKTHSPNHIHVIIKNFFYNSSSFLHLNRCKIHTSRHSKNHLLCPIQVCLKKWVFNSLSSSINCSLLSSSVSNSKQRISRVKHYFSNICKVDINISWLSNQIRNTLNSKVKYLVNHSKCLLKRCLFIN